LRFAHHWNQHTKEEDYQQFYQTDNFLYKCAFMFLLFWCLSFIWQINALIFWLHTWAHAVQSQFREIFGEKNPRILWKR